LGAIQVQLIIFHTSKAYTEAIYPTELGIEAIIWKHRCCSR